MHPSILKSFEMWLETGEFPSQPIYAGFSPMTLQKLCPIKPPAIFLLLDWLSREPKDALRAINDEFIPK